MKQKSTNKLWSLKKGKMNWSVFLFVVCLSSLVFGRNEKFYVTGGISYPISLVRFMGEVTDGWRDIAKDTEGVEITDPLGCSINLTLGGYDGEKNDAFGLGWVIGYAAHHTSTIEVRIPCEECVGADELYVTGKASVREIRFIPMITRFTSEKVAAFDLSGNEAEGGVAFGIGVAYSFIDAEIGSNLGPDNYDLFSRVLEDKWTDGFIPILRVHAGNFIGLEFSWTRYCIAVGLVLAFF